jgi:hypothetical protein
MDEYVDIPYIWSIKYPEYAERMAVMSHPANVHNAFYSADMLFLTPKE